MRPLAAAVPLVVTAALLVVSTVADAQDGIFGNLQKSLDSSFSSVSTRVTDVSGVSTTVETKNINPRLTLNLDSLVYPNLRLNAGGVFEVNRSFTRNLFSVDGSVM